MTTPKPSTAIRTGFILEDIPAAQTWLTDVLEEAFPGIAIAVAGTVKQAHAMLSVPPDVALIDLSLPDGSGMDILKLIKNTRAATACVVTTIYDDDTHLFPALRAKADGYLLKDRPKAELVDELKRILDNQPPLSPAIARKILGSFAETKADPPLAEPLTTRQLEVLRMIAQGTSIQGVADALDISYHTAASHVRSIYNRLGVSTRAEAASKAIRMGLD